MNTLIDYMISVKILLFIKPVNTAKWRLVMKKRIKRFESTMWLAIKIALYALIMATFMIIMGINNPTIIRPSRTMGIIMSTYVISGL